MKLADYQRYIVRISLLLGDRNRGTTTAGELALLLRKLTCLDDIALYEHCLLSEIYLYTSTISATFVPAMCSSMVVATDCCCYTGTLLDALLLLCYDLVFLHPGCSRDAD